MSGRRRSRSTTAGSRSATRRSASSPEPAVATSKPSRPSSRASTLRKASSSSTRRSVTGAFTGPTRSRPSSPPPGSRTSKVDPAPGTLSTAISPPQRRTKLWDRKRPRPVPPFRRLTNGSKIRFRCSGGMPQPVVRDPDARRGRRARRSASPCRPDRQAWIAFSSRLMSTCCSSASSARTCRPGGSGPTSIRTPRSRAVGSISRATARDRRVEVHDVGGGLSARHPQEVLGDAPAAEELLAGDRLRSRRSLDHSGLCAAARAPRRRIPSTQVRTVPSGVFSSCEKPEASMPERGEAVRLGEAGLGRAPLGDVAPHLDDLDERPVRARGSGEACTSSQATDPSGSRRSQMRTCALAGPEAGESRAVAERAEPTSSRRGTSSRPPRRARCPCGAGRRRSRPRPFAAGRARRCRRRCC